MAFPELVAVSSLSAARMGIDGLVVMVLYFGGGWGVILALSRHEYSPRAGGIFGVLAATSIGALVGSLSGTVVMMISAGLAASLTSGPFLGFRLRHRVILSFLLSALLMGALWIGALVQRWVSGGL